MLCIFKIKFKCRKCGLYKKRASKFSTTCINCFIPDLTEEEVWEHRRASSFKKNKQVESSRLNSRRKNLFYTKLKIIKESSFCQDCKQFFPAVCMDFDHRPEEEKIREVGAMGSYRWELVEEEMLKCDLVCSNCHRIRTANRRLQASVAQ